MSKKSFSLITHYSSLLLTVVSNRQGFVDAAVRARDDVDADELADAAGGGGACVCSSFDRRDITADNRRHESGADLLVADQRDVRGLDHRVRRLDHRHQTLRLNHSECFLRHSVFLLDEIYSSNQKQYPPLTFTIRASEM